MKNAKINLLLASMLISFQANAESLGTIEVIADDLGSQNHSVSASNYKVRQPQTMAEVLRNVEGVGIGNPIGIAQRYYIRGVPDYNLNVTVDGARQSGYGFHHAGNYAVDPELLKQVKVSVGNNSLINAGGSLGGSIQYKTADASDLLAENKDFGAKVKFNYGTNDKALQTSLALFGKVNNVELLAYGNHRNTDNGKDANKVMIRNDSKLKNYLFKAKFNLAEDFYFKLGTEHYDNRAFTNQRANFGYVFNGGKPQPLSYYTSKRDTHTFEAAFNPKNNDLINTTFNLYTSKNKQSSMSGRLNTDISTSGLEIRNISALENHIFTYGFEYYKKKAKNIGLKQSEQAKSASFYIQDEILLGDKFSLSPALRYENYKVNLHKFDSSESKLLKALGLKYFANENLTLYSNYTELFKGTELNETALIERAKINKNLKGVKGDNKEIGFEFAQNNYNLNGKYFYTTYDNYQYSFRERSNLGKSVVKGFEANAKYQFNEQLSLRLGVAKSKSTIKDSKNKNIVNGSTLLNDTGTTFNLGINYLPTSEIEVGFNTRIVKGFNKLSSSRAGAKDNPETFKPTLVAKKLNSYAVSDLYVVYHPKALENAEITFGIDNLFNKHYIDHSNDSGQYERGRNYKLTFSYNF